MNLIENIKEGLRSVQANLLRSVLTACIVMIGITALVGILTAIDGIEQSVTESFASLGVNTFDITSRTNRNTSQGGVEQKIYPNLKLYEVQRFIDMYNVPATVSLNAFVTFAAEVKHLSKKTNPNVNIMGINDEYTAIKALEFDKGRNFSKLEIEYGTPVIIIGDEITQALFDKNESPLGKDVTVLGRQFKVIGTLKKKGGGFGNNTDNMIFVPVRVGNQMAEGRALNYRLTVGISNPEQFEMAMGEATGLMRMIRQDRVGQENSFELEKSETLAERTATITGYLRMGGFGVGFITLLGASIALMNIMLVSVTERTREVGVRKALGATPLRIRQQFVIEAIVVCVLGGIAGVILGIIIGNLLGSLMGISRIVVPWMWMLVGIIVCIVVGLISGYYPAHKASKLDPIESLRFE